MVMEPLFGCRGAASRANDRTSWGRAPRIKAVRPTRPPGHHPSRSADRRLPSHAGKSPEFERGPRPGCSEVRVDD